MLARDLGYLTIDEWKRLENERCHAARLAWRLYGAVRRAAEDETGG